jgi:hypothetical protein
LLCPSCAVKFTIGGGKVLPCRKFDFRIHNVPLSIHAYARR